MIINKTLLQNAEPRNGNVLWAQPVGDKLELKMYNKGKWSTVAGDSSSSDKTIIGDDYIPLNTLLKFDFDQDQWNNMSLDEINEYIALKLKNVSISTRKHGDIVNICANSNNFVYLCSDGYMLTEGYDSETQTVYYKELAPYFRYLIRTLTDTTNYLAVVDTAYEKVVPLKDVADLTNVIYASDFELGKYSSNLNVGCSIIFYLKHNLSQVSFSSENLTYWDSNTKTSEFEMTINFGRNNNFIQITKLNN